VARPAAGIADGFLGHVLRTADADRRGRGLQAVVVAIALADLPRCGAQGAAQQREEAALLPGVETVFVDPEDGARLQGEYRTIAQAKLGTAAGAGADRVAGLELEACLGRYRARSAGLRTIDRHLARGGEQA